MKLDDYSCDYCHVALSSSEALDRHSGRHARIDPCAGRMTGKPIRTATIDLALFEQDKSGYVNRRRRPFNPVRVLVA